MVPKDPALAQTRPLKPAGPHVHIARPEYRVFVVKGTVECLLVCECGQRAKLWERAIPGFHAPEPEAA
jgi:hypothetical protein